MAPVVNLFTFFLMVAFRNGGGCFAGARITKQTPSSSTEATTKGLMKTIPVQDSIQGTTLNRSFAIHIPSSSQQQESYLKPMIMSFHGIASTAETQEEFSKFDLAGNEENWIIVYPQGEHSFPATKITNWNGAGCCTQKQDDVAFARAIVDYMVETHDVDPSLVFATGFSNGGFMAYRLACEMGLQPTTGRPYLRAAAVHSGLLGEWNPTKNGLLSCGGEEGFNDNGVPPPLMHIHDTSDPVVPFHGKPAGERFHKIPYYPLTMAKWMGFNESMDFWANLKCNSTDLVGTYSITETTKCSHKCHGDVSFCQVNGLGHHWSGSDVEGLSAYDPNYAIDLDATFAIIDFFKKYV